MNNYLKIGISAVVGAAAGVAVTYLVMERLVNWFDLVFASARAEVTLSALEDFDRKGAAKGIEAVRNMLETELELAKAKCAYFSCSENPEKYGPELRTIERASQYLEQTYVTQQGAQPPP